MFNDDINIAVVVSAFNSDITDKLLEGTFSTLIKSGIHKEKIKVIKVPGAVEIPLIAQLCAQSKKYKAIICLGSIIRGDTNHYEYVCEQVSQGCLRVMLDFNIPVIFGVLTTKNLKQAQDRVSDKKLSEHKGVEAANTAISMIKLIQTTFV